MRLDDFIQGCWLQCDEWYFSFRYDHLWVLVGTCKHQRFEQVAPLFKIERGVEVLYDQVSNYHDEVKIYDDKASDV